MRYDVRNTLELAAGCPLFVDQKRRFPKRDRSQIFHGAGSEIRDRNQVQLVPRVGQVVVAAKERQREAADLARKVCQVELPGYGPDAKGSIADHDRLRTFELADDKREKIRGHLDAV